MIDHNQAIQGKKVIYFRRKDMMVLLSDGKNAQGKWRIINIAFGDTRAIFDDLKTQGCDLRPF